MWSPRRARPTPTWWPPPGAERRPDACWSPTTSRPAGAGRTGPGPRRRAPASRCRCCSRRRSRCRAGPGCRCSPGSRSARRYARSAGLAAGLKWPNDVLVGERKLCGILAERVDTPSGPACVIGIGINVSSTEADLPGTDRDVAADRPGRGRPARRAGPYAVGRRRTPGAGARGARVAGRPGRRRAGGALPGRCVTLGRPVRVLLGDQRVLTGVATGIDPDGRLMVRTESGTQILGAGDVVHVR